MKSPQELAQKLARQWKNATHREALLAGTLEWPVRLPIGLPPPQLLANNWPKVKDHLDLWRAVTEGVVDWERVPYRSTDEPVLLPVAWSLFNADEWARATQSSKVRQEYKCLLTLLSASDLAFHSMLIKNRSIWQYKELPEVMKAVEVAAMLERGCAEGAPLRAVSLAGIDTKFFERNRNLITRLLDLRFEGEASSQSLEVFLGAAQAGDHWLLVADLDGGILPVPLLRARGSDLLNARICAKNLVIVENERCLHLLPRNAPGTVAVLGTGNNLQWLSAAWVERCRVAYWGDIDTWGLTLLHHARSFVPELTPLLMNQAVFERHAPNCAVRESVVASLAPPSRLCAEEITLYKHLLRQERGRLEQEFLLADEVESALAAWCASL